MLASLRVLKRTAPYMRTPRTVEMIRKARLVPQPSPPNLMYWKTIQVMFPPVVKKKMMIKMMPLQVKALPPSFSTLLTSKSFRLYARTRTRRA